jgi:hypothetical protein
VYYEKAVRHIGTIIKVVECEISDGRVTSETIRLTDEERKRIAAASETAMNEQGWDLATGYQFFLCDEMCDTMFQKSTPGGIMGHRYFDLRTYFSASVPTRLAEIADNLKELEWE